MILLVIAPSFNYLLKYAGKAEKESCCLVSRLNLAKHTKSFHRTPYDSFSVMLTISDKENIKSWGFFVISSSFSNI